jgi:hypothetical protein
MRCAMPCGTTRLTRSLTTMRFWSSTKLDFSSKASGGRSWSMAAAGHSGPRASCGVARQYTGSVGKITNCQIGVFACYVSRHGHAFIDRALYLPRAWVVAPCRMEAAHVPKKTGFATKPALVADAGRIRSFTSRSDDAQRVALKCNCNAKRSSPLGSRPE